ncbi:MAG: VOC family protein [Myxococcota bacterium]
MTAPIMPMLAYADPAAAIDFLVQAFGFTERYRLAMPDGSLGHAELVRGEAVVSLASAWRDAGLFPPTELNGCHCQLAVMVSDVDAHWAHAREAGATIVAAPEDQFYGFRMYRALDPEGHRWIFQQKLREVSPEELQAMLT